MSSTPSRMIVLACAAAFFCRASAVLAQGSLTPPGAPAPTMKMLEQVEPRIPLDRAPVAIERAGSYYLTDNLQGTVTVLADNVSLDLMGFTITSREGENAVVLDDVCKNFRIHNGVLSLLTQDGVGVAAATGASVGLNGRIESLRVSGGRYGISVGNGCTVRDCQVYGADTGIRVSGNSVVRDCRLEGNVTGLRVTGKGAFIADNIVRANTGNYDLVAGNQLQLILSEVPVTLAWPCSAKLAGSLSSTTHGVTVSASGVTLDLMGFTLSGDLGSTDYGVYLAGTAAVPLNSVVVRNGGLRNFGMGVYAEQVVGNRFEGLNVSSNSNYGVYFYGQGGQCSGNVIADCSLVGNAFYGCYLYSSTGRCNGNTLDRCTICNNGNQGLYLSGAYGQCVGNAVTACSISGNGSHGVYLSGYDGQCDGNTIARCRISGNAARGIYIYGYLGQCDGNVISDCTLSGNSYGIYLYGTGGQCDGNALSACTVDGNGSYGVYFNGSSGRCDGNSVVGCVIRQHTASGIYVKEARNNRIADNQVSCYAGSAPYGILCESTSDNLILKNMCAGHTSNFSITTNDTYGPVVSSGGSLATSGTSAHPWANFSR
ncbi:MAG TPA: NosD domain-containing protein [Kiritimatiellia bacterium]|nr:NosD domain-containing protein [Kiritimatiellia bacterium]HPS09471.1 NosD domain-containing protein [Kiritimatiellia bacterium]